MSSKLKLATTMQPDITEVHSKFGDCGVCIFVNSIYKDDVLSSSSFSESVWCRILLTGNNYLLLGVIYRSPNSDEINFNQLCDLLHSTSNYFSKCKHIS